MFREHTYNTTDLALAAALAAMGIPFASTPFISTKTTKRESYVFIFQPASPCGQHSTGDLLKAWDDADWHEKNPEHPFAYIKCAFKNREALLDQVKSAAPLVMIEKAGKVAVISGNASAELQTKIFGRL